MMSTTDILDRLNEYVGNNVWREFITGLPVDWVATDAAPDVAGTFFLVDGTEFHRNMWDRVWRAW